MKALITTLALLVGATANASLLDKVDTSFWRGTPLPTADSSWEEILTDNRLVADIPILRRNDGLVISTLNACYDAAQDSFFSLTPYRNRECVRWEADTANGIAGRHCAEYGETTYSYAQIPAVQTTFKCVKYDYSKANKFCGEFQEVDYRLPLEHTATVSKKGNGANKYDRNDTELFAKSIVIPACAE